MPRRKKIIEDEPNEEQPVIVDAVKEPVEEVIPETCSQGYDFEVPGGVRSLLVDGGTLALMLAGAFRPHEKYDQVVYQAASGLYFGLFLAFRAVRPGGLFWVRPELAGMNMFRDCLRDEMGGMVRITKK